MSHSLASMKHGLVLVEGQSSYPYTGLESQVVSIQVAELQARRQQPLVQIVLYVVVDPGQPY